MEITTDNLDADALDGVVAAAFGRPPAVTEGKATPPAPSTFAVMESELQELAAAAATPWRAACRESERAPLAAAEARFVDLVSSRRGQSPKSATAYVEQALREAWHNPATGFGATQGRLDAVSATLREGIASLEKLAPLMGTASPTIATAVTAARTAREAAKAGSPRSTTRIVQEIQR